MGVKITTKVKSGGLDGVKKRCGGSAQLLGGVLGNPVSHETGEKIALYAYYNEFGTVNTPARPFLRNAVEKHEAEWRKMLEAALRSGLSMRQALEAIRNVVRADIVASIKASGDFDPLSPETIKVKERKGTTNAATPLIDTTSLIRSIATEVRE